jgi:SAM-dependent methyltransferase
MAGGNKLNLNSTQTNGNGLRIQFGCGFHAPAGWRNFDASPTLRFERLPLLGRAYVRNGQRFPRNVEFGDIVKGLPLPPASCAVIYASHVLEHLSLNDFHTALNHCFELLKSGGLFRLVVPDLEALANRYLSSREASAAKAFMEETSLGVAHRTRGVRGLMSLWLGNSSHLWMWDFKALQLELSDAGFVDVQRCTFADNPLFREVEQQERFINSVAVQGRRP